MKTESLRKRLYTVVFEADTPAGRAFDVTLLVLILGSIVVISLETIEPIYQRHQRLFWGLDWSFTVIFTAEYLLRLWVVNKPLKYATSFYGIIDLLAVLPTYLNLIYPDLHFLLVIRSLRLLRVFRVFGLVHFLNESNFLLQSLWTSRRKILVFLLSVVLTTVISGALMYVIEHEHNPSFSSIPQSVYWAIVTLTTVGYGDISPETALGRLLASFLMLLGYCIIAVPTGIVSASLLRGVHRQPTSQTCPNCLRQGHEADAVYCKFCGTHL